MSDSSGGTNRVGRRAALHLVSSRQAEVVTGVWYQIAKASSSNATASRRFTALLTDPWVP
jgi:hypothetical protein